MVHKRRVSTVTCIAFVGALFFMVPNARAATALQAELAWPVVTENSTAELQNLGCVPPQIEVVNDGGILGGSFSGGLLTSLSGATSSQTRRYTYPDSYVHVWPNDVPEDLVYDQSLFCPPEASYKVVNTDGGRAQSRDVGVKASQPKPPLWQQNIIYVINGFLIILANVGLWLVALASEIAAPLIQVSKFRTHPFVQLGWPFVQGIANLGFILALLFIAGATVLRLDIQGGIRRLLPRLLIAALLINFSLLLGTILIDASRITMAAIVRVMGVDNLYQIGLQTLQSSDLPRGIIAAGSFVGEGGTVDSWNIPLKYLQSVILIWAMAIGLGMVAVLLVVRYIALLLLLIASPLAYLSAALPGASRLTKLWWTNFLKWVVYGPIVLFLLTIISQAGFVLAEQNENASFFAISFNVLLTVILLIMTATFGLKLGGSSASFAMGLATGTLRRTARGATAPVRVPARIAGQEIKKSAKKQGADFYKAGRQAFRSRFLGARPGDKSLGAQVGGKVFGKPLTPAQRRQQTTDRQAARGAAGQLGAVALRGEEAVARGVVQGDSRLSATNLRKGTFATELHKQNAQNTLKIARHGDVSRVEALTNNEDLVKEMTDEQRIDFENAVRENNDLNDDQKSKMIKTLGDKVTKIADKAGTEPKGP